MRHRVLVVSRTGSTVVLALVAGHGCEVVGSLRCSRVCPSRRAKPSAPPNSLPMLRDCDGRADQGQVLACMGQPANKTTERTAEVWSYLSGMGPSMPGTAAARGWAPGARSQSKCTINMTMVGGRVTKLSFVGPDGELVIPNQQCAFALEDPYPALRVRVSDVCYFPSFRDGA